MAIPRSRELLRSCTFTVSPVVSATSMTGLLPFLFSTLWQVRRKIHNSDPDLSAHTHIVAHLGNKIHMVILSGQYFFGFHSSPPEGIPVREILGKRTSDLCRILPAAFSHNIRKPGSYSPSLGPKILQDARSQASRSSISGWDLWSSSAIFLVFAVK